MAKITFWSGGTADAPSFYRCQEPARVLAARGHETLSAKQIGLGTLMSSDVVVIARATEAETLGWVEKLKKLRQGPEIVYELDDDLLSIPEHFPIAIREPLADPLRRDRIRRFLELADRVTVTSPHLAERVREELEITTDPLFGRRTVRVVPNWVPARLVRNTLPSAHGLPPTIIGWQGSATHKVDFERCVIPLRRILRDRDDTSVHIFGPDYARRLRTAAPIDRVEHTSWVEGVEVAVRALDALDLGLAPLEANTFNLSKSDLKLKEYAARGVAAIATGYGPYATGNPLTVPPGIRIDEEMFPGREADVWSAAITAALDNPDALEQARNYALAWAKANTLENHAEQWEDALLS